MFLGRIKGAVNEQKQEQNAPSPRRQVGGHGVGLLGTNPSLSLPPLSPKKSPVRKKQNLGPSPGRQNLSGNSGINELKDLKAEALVVSTSVNSLLQQPTATNARTTTGPSGTTILTAPTSFNGKEIKRLRTPEEISEERNKKLGKTSRWICFGTSTTWQRSLQHRIP